MFCLRALSFLEEIERRFFDAESTDADASIDRGARKSSKTIEKIIAFAICLHEEIDASRLSGPEQFFACAPYIFFKKSNVVFRRRIDRCRCLDRSRCSKPIENGRKNHSVRYMFCLLYTSPSPRDLSTSRMPSSA